MTMAGMLRKDVPPSTMEWLMRQAHWEVVDGHRHLIWDGYRSKTGSTPMVATGTGHSSMAVRRRVLAECGRKLHGGNNYWCIAKCRVDGCVDPIHLAEVTRSEAMKGRKRIVTPRMLASAYRAAQNRIVFDGKEALRLRRQGLTYLQIADAIGCAPSTVPDVIKRGLRETGQMPMASVFNPSAVLRASPARNDDSVRSAA